MNCLILRSCKSWMNSLNFFGNLERKQRLKSFWVALTLRITKHFVLKGFILNRDRKLPFEQALQHGGDNEQQASGCSAAASLILLMG